MDAQQFLMAHAEQQWDDKYNAFVNAVVPALEGGGTVTNVDSPITWLNGYTGYSNATILANQNVKLVILSISHLNATAAKNGQAVGTLPTNLSPTGSNYIRMVMSQNTVIANTGATRLDVWTNGDLSSQQDLYGSAIYCASN